MSQVGDEERDRRRATIHTTCFPPPKSQRAAHFSRSAPPAPATPNPVPPPPPAPPPARLEELQTARGDLAQAGRPDGVVHHHQQLGRHAALHHVPLHVRLAAARVPQRQHACTRARARARKQGQEAVSAKDKPGGRDDAGTLGGWAAARAAAQVARRRMRKRARGPPPPLPPVPASPSCMLFQAALRRMARICSRMRSARSVSGSTAPSTCAVGVV